MREYSPGDWHTVARDVFIPRGEDFIVISQQAPKNYPLLRAERLANARLIAAAPALLAALRDVLASATPNPKEHPAMTAAWLTARAVIAKAEGR